MKVLKFMTSKTNREFLLGAAMVFLIIMQIQTCNNNRQLAREVARTHQINAQNQAALTDTIIRIEKNRNNESEAVRTAFVTNMENLKSLNKKLYDESRKEIGELKAIISGQITASQQPLTISNALERYNDGKYGLKFSNSTTKWDIAGVSKFRLDNNVLYPDSTNISVNSLRINLVMGFKEHDDKYEIFARSDDPSIVVSKMDGAIFISKKNDITCPPVKPQKKLGLGLHLGYGFSTQGIGPIMGVGLSYNLISF
jgi:hypothetical protein